MKTTPRHYVMCPPTFFAVTYTINPWMDPTRPVDADLAMVQWTNLRRTYEDLGHQVDLLEPLPDMPDMVFTANGAFVIGRRALGSRFRAAEREGESEAHRSWLTRREIAFQEAHAVNEGEGDFIWTGRYVLAGTGFRSSPAAHRELREVFGVPVIALELVDPRFYHLDTAFAMLDAQTVAYYPAAFSEPSRDLLGALYPDAIIAGQEDALVLGLNATSDGRHVVMAAQAKQLAAQFADAGFEPVPVDMSEFLKAGGGAKCATLELHGSTLSEPDERSDAA